MKKIALLAAMALLCVAPSAAQSVKQTVVYVKVSNHSDRCAWVTIYWGRPHVPWTIEHETPDGRPQFVHKGKYHVFPVIFRNPTSVPLTMEIKVRAEFQNADCGGRTAADREAYNKSVGVDKGIVQEIHIGSALQGPPYSVSTPQ